jgi:RNA polymerase sigma factor (sigma-70 family)
MLEAQWLPLAQSYLARPNRDLATTEERCAWEQFHRMSLAVTLASIRRVHAARVMSEDVTQDVLTKLVENLPDFNLDPARGDLESWVKAIASHEAWRRVRRRVKRHEGPLDPDLADQVLDPEPGPDVELERIQEHELFKTRVTEFAARLPEPDGRIVMLHWVNGYSLSTIASEMSVSKDKIAWVVRREAPRLVDYLRRCGFDEAC